MSILMAHMNACVSTAATSKSLTPISSATLSPAPVAARECEPAKQGNTGVRAEAYPEERNNMIIPSPEVFLEHPGPLYRRIAETETNVLKIFLLAIVTGVGLGIGLYLVRKKLK